MTIKEVTITMSVNRNKNKNKHKGKRKPARQPGKNAVGRQTGGDPPHPDSGRGGAIPAGREIVMKPLADLKVDPELRDLIPRPSPEDREALKQAIISAGNQITVPLLVGEGDGIWDGFTRHEIAGELRISMVPVISEPGPITNERKAQLVMEAVGRRSLSMWQRIQLAFRLKTLEAKRARDRMSAGGKKAQGKDDCPDLGEMGQTRDILAKRVGLPGKGKQVDAGMKLLESGRADIISRVDAGDIKLSAAYKLVFPPSPTKSAATPKSSRASQASAKETTEDPGSDATSTTDEDLDDDAAHQPAHANRVAGTPTSPHAEPPLGDGHAGEDEGDDPAEDDQPRHDGVRRGDLKNNDIVALVRTWITFLERMSNTLDEGRLIRELIAKDYNLADRLLDMIKAISLSAESGLEYELEHPGDSDASETSTASQPAGRQ